MFKDKQLGKRTAFSFPRPFSNNPDNVSGIFSYGDNEGLIWNGLVPEQEGEKPSFNSYEEALEAYNSHKN